MASASVDLVRSIYATWEGGDFSSAAWADPEIEYVRADGPAPGRWTGVTGMEKGFREFLNAWDEYRIEADEYRELDHERILVLVHHGGRGKTSGLELGHIQSRGAMLFQISHGKVIKLVSYFDREHALAELGLAPETAP